MKDLRLRNLILCIFIFMIGFLKLSYGIIDIFADESQKAKKKIKVLQLNSYNLDEKWTKDINTGIKFIKDEQGIAIGADEIDLKELNLDYIAGSDINEIFAEKKASILREEFDILLIVGKEAYEILKLIDEDFIKDRSVIIAGIPDFNDLAGLKDNYYVVKMQFEFDKVVKRVFDVCNRLDNLIVIEDSNGIYNFEMKKRILTSNYREKLHFIDKSESNSIIDEIKNIPGKNAVLLTPMDTLLANGIVFNTIPNDLLNKNDIPVFSIWEIHNVSGKLRFAGGNEGVVIKRVIGKLQEGKPPKKITVFKSDKWKFNQQILARHNSLKFDIEDDEFYNLVPKNTKWTLWLLSAVTISLFLVLLNYLSFNISKRKAAEKDVKESQLKLMAIQESSKIRSDFFANITHDIRTPIGVILSIVQLLKKSSHDEEFYRNSSGKYMDSIKDNCNRLLRISSNLIDMTKIESGYMDLEKKNYEVISLIENLVGSISELCRKKEIDLVFDTDIEELFLYCDGYKIERVLMNILSNAVKFTPNRGSIFVDVTQCEENISIRVKDTGIGMELSDKSEEQMFDRFSMEKGNQKINGQGCGIGLFIVKSIVTKHDGTVEVRSKREKGTQFTIKLPKVFHDSSPKVIVHQDDAYSDRVNVEFSSL